LQGGLQNAIFLDMRKKLLPITILLASVIGLGACQSAPPQPLFRPLESGAAYGYTDRQIDETHWEVTYTGPRYRSSYGDNSRKDESEAARTEAYDLALWRAAQIALEQKKPRFAVVSERRDVDRSTQVDRYPSYPYYPYGYRRSFWGYWPNYNDDYSVRSYHDAMVTLTIDLNPPATAQAIDAKETADRLEAQYAFKTWRPT